MLKKNVTHLSNEALYSLASGTIREVMQVDSVAVSGTPQYKAIEPARAAFFAVLNKEPSSGMGEEVERLDRGRGYRLSGLYEVVKGMSHFSALETNAKKLLPLFEKEQQKRRMGRKTYAQETAAIDRLHEDLNTTENAAIMTALGISTMENEMYMANQMFKTYYLQSVDKNAALLYKSSATKKRKPLEDALRNFFMLVEAMKDIEPWTGLHTDLSELAKKTKV